MEGKEARCLLDSGCMVGNVVDAGWLASAGGGGETGMALLRGMTPYTGKAATADRSAITSIQGVVYMPVQLQCGPLRYEGSHSFIVMKSVFPLILGWKILISDAFDFYLSVLRQCRAQIEAAPTMRQLKDYRSPAVIYKSLRHLTPHHATAHFREQGVFGSASIKIVESENGGWGLKATRSMRRGSQVMMYSSKQERPAGQTSDVNVHYAVQLADGRIFDAPDEGDLQLGPLANTKYSVRGNNLRFTVSPNTGNLYLTVNRNVKPDEDLCIAYGAENVAKLLQELRPSMSGMAWQHQRQLAEAYYECSLVGAVDFHPSIGDLVEPFASPAEIAEEDDLINPVYTIPEDVLAVAVDPLEERREAYHKMVPEKASDALKQNYADFAKFMQQSEIVDVFVAPDWTGIKHPETGETWVINIEWHAVPKASKAKPIRVRPSQLEPSHKELLRMLGLGFLLEAHGPIASPLLVVPKATDPFIRLVSHYAWLTTYLSVPKYPLPHVRDSLNFIKAGYGDDRGGFKVFFDLDMTNSFHQIRIDTASSEYLSIVTPWGQFRPVFLPEGIAPATAILQQVVDAVFRNERDCTLAIYDNILVCGIDMEDALRNFKRVVTQAAKCNVKLKLAKCSFGVESIKFFGYQCHAGTYELDDERILKSQEIPFPGDDTRATPKQKRAKMQSYLGVGGFFEPFTLGYAELSVDLYDMTKEDFSWDESTWTKDYKKAFERHRDALLHTFRIYFPDYSLEWFLEVDASNRALGGILYQVHPTLGKQPLAILGHKFSTTAQRWHIVDKEAFGGFHCITKLARMLRGKHFTLVTDANNTRYMEKSANPRVQRMHAALVGFSFGILHIPGKLNVVSDWISRMYPEDPEEAAEMIAALTEALAAISTDDPDDPAVVAALHMVTDWLSDIHPESTVANALTVLCSVIEDAHAGAQGHHGALRTYKLMKELYPDTTVTMQEVKTFVEDCAICQKLRSESNTLQPIPKSLRSTHARNVVAFDTASIVMSPSGNRYILIVYNLFTKYVVLYAVANKDARTTARCLMRYFAQHGLHDLCHSDPGSDFTAKEVSDLLTGWLGMGRTFTLVDNPQADGVEPAVKNVVTKLRALCLETGLKEEWDDDVTLSLVQLVLNEQESTQTGVSPLQAQFGHVDAKHFAIPSEVRKSCDSDWVRAVSKQLLHIRTLSAAYQKKIKDSRGPAADFVQARYQPGEFVFIIQGKWDKPSKLHAQGFGPLEVLDHPKDSNHVKLRSLVDGRHHTEDLKDLRIFVGSRDDAIKLARTDTAQHELQSINGYVGDPTLRTKMEFSLLFTDGDTRWAPYGKDVFDTQPFEAFCQADPYLSLLLLTASEAQREMARHKNKVIPESLINTTFYVELRRLDSTWYEGLEHLPDHLTTSYVVAGHYGAFTDSYCKNILTRIPLLGDSFTSQSFFIHFHGYRTELGPGDVLLTREDVPKYKLVPASKGK